MILSDDMEYGSLHEDLFEMEERLRKMLKSSFRRDELEAERSHLDDLFCRIPETPRWTDAQDLRVSQWREIRALNRSFLSASVVLDLLDRASRLSRRYFREEEGMKKDFLSDGLRAFEEDIVLRFERRDILLDYLRSSHFVITRIVPLVLLASDGYFDLDLFRCAFIQIGMEDDPETLLIHFCRFVELVDGLDMLVPEASTGAIRINYRVLHSPWLNSFLGYAPRTSRALTVERSGEDKRRSARKLVLSYLDRTSFDPGRWTSQRPVMDALVPSLAVWTVEDDFFLSSLIAIVCRREEEKDFLPLMRRIEENGSIERLLR